MIRRVSREKPYQPSPGSHRLRRGHLRARLARLRGEHPAVSGAGGDLGAAVALSVGSLVCWVHHRGALPRGSSLRDGEQGKKLNISVTVTVM